MAQDHVVLDLHSSFTQTVINAIAVREQACEAVACAKEAIQRARYTVATARMLMAARSTNASDHAAAMRSRLVRTSRNRV